MMTEQQATGYLANALREFTYPESYLTELQNFLGIGYHTTPLSLKQASLLQQVLFSLSQQVPVEYLVGRALFYEHYFAVTRDVLIPRFDTEILVTKTIDLMNNLKGKTATIVDIGTGSGAIIISVALALAKFVNVFYVAIDPSQKALNIAKLNATTYALSDRIVFKNDRDFPKTANDEPYIPDTEEVIIVSNPPYIASEHFLQLPDSVKKYEPALALKAQPTFLPALESYLEKLNHAGKDCHLFLEYNTRNRNMTTVEISPYTTSEALQESLHEKLG